jgi:tRNA(Ile)-lysidine synthase
MSIGPCSPSGDGLDEPPDTDRLHVDRPDVDRPDTGHLDHDRFVADLLTRCTFPSAGTHVVCALSGGPDSTALVALAVAAGCTVHAIHVDHGLRDDSSIDARLAAAGARRLGVTFHAERIELDDGPNLEARARAARRRVLGPDVLTGHTADDQAETVLLALLRGSGATGLAGMTPGATKPLLGLRRHHTRTLCEMMNLPVANDPTNSHSRFRRNRIRHELLPLIGHIAERDVTPLITRAADLLRDDDTLLGELAAALDPTDALALAAAPRPLARRALRRWLTLDGYPPDAAAIERVLAVVVGQAGACEISGGRRVTRSGQRLRLFSECDSSR